MACSTFAACGTAVGTSAGVAGARVTGPVLIAASLGCMAVAFLTCTWDGRRGAEGTDVDGTSSAGYRAKDLVVAAVSMSCRAVALVCLDVRRRGREQSRCGGRR